MRFFRIPSFTGIEAHRDDADRGSLRVVEGCLPYGPGGLRSGPVWETVGGVEIESETEINQLRAADDGNGNSALFVSRLDQVHELAIISTENTAISSFGENYSVVEPVGLYRDGRAFIAPVGNQLYSFGDGDGEAVFIGKGTGNKGVFPDEELYSYEWSKFPNCKFFVQGPKKTIYASGNPSNPLRVYISEPASITNPRKDSPYSTEEPVLDTFPGRLSVVDIIGSNADYISALSSRGDQVVVHTNKGCHLLYAPTSDQAETGYRVEQAPATNFSAAVSSQVVAGETGSMNFWLGHDGQIYKDESASRGAEDVKNYADPAQVSWKSKSIWEKELPVALQNSFSAYDRQSGMYWVFVESPEYLDYIKNTPPGRAVNLNARTQEPAAVSALNTLAIEPEGASNLTLSVQLPEGVGDLDVLAPVPAAVDDLEADTQAPQGVLDLLLDVEIPGQVEDLSLAGEVPQSVDDLAVNPELPGGVDDLEVQSPPAGADDLTATPELPGQVNDLIVPLDVPDQVPSLTLTVQDPTVVIDFKAEPSIPASVDDLTLTVEAPTGVDDLTLTIETPAEVGSFDAEPELPPSVSLEVTIDFPEQIIDLNADVELPEPVSGLILSERLDIPTGTGTSFPDHLPEATGVRISWSPGDNYPIKNVYYELVYHGTPDPFGEDSAPNGLLEEPGIQRLFTTQTQHDFVNLWQGSVYAFQVRAHYDGPEYRSSGFGQATFDVVGPDTAGAAKTVRAFPKLPTGVQTFGVSMDQTPAVAQELEAETLAPAVVRGFDAVSESELLDCRGNDIHDWAENRDGDLVVAGTTSGLQQYGGDPFNTDDILFVTAVRGFNLSPWYKVSMSGDGAQVPTSEAAYDSTGSAFWINKSQTEPALGGGVARGIGEITTTYYGGAQDDLNNQYQYWASLGGSVTTDNLSNITNSKGYQFLKARPNSQARTFKAQVGYDQNSSGSRPIRYDIYLYPATDPNNWMLLFVHELNNVKYYYRNTTPNAGACQITGKYTLDSAYQNYGMPHDFYVGVKPFRYGQNGTKRGGAFHSDGITTFALDFHDNLQPEYP